MIDQQGGLTCDQLANVESDRARENFGKTGGPSDRMSVSHNKAPNSSNILHNETALENPGASKKLRSSMVEQKIHGGTKS